MLHRLWSTLKSELGVALRTFLAAWLALTSALQLWCLLENPKLHGAEDVLLWLSFGFLICAFYAFWPACALTACRVVYRILGWGAYVGALLSALGVSVTLLLARPLFGQLLAEVFAHLGGLGPCAAHATGPAALFALVCLVAAIVSSPASLWAVFELFMLLGACVLVGALPGLLLWVGLLLRQAAKLASGRFSR